MILLIDNYDSFTYNLYQMLRKLDIPAVVKRNDEISIKEVEEMKPEGIILSPGPGTPDSAGICKEIVKNFSKSIPILGICLGHQVIAEAFGGLVKKAPLVKHGKTSTLNHDGKGIFQGIENAITVMRYHSLHVESNSLPRCLEVTAVSLEDEAVMGLKHREYPVTGLQFHPESIATQYGMEMMSNFIKSMERGNLYEKLLT
ncbi:anthranilate synthase component II [Peribacillus sp. SCS-37]|uniref:anthranilate synthase component II n=1 Tax=Paraperibacillus esterisolvens TaxID=3115296 RepID=UPI0039068DCD